MFKRALIILIPAVATLVAQQPAAAPAGRGGGKGPGRPALFFREEWKQSEKGGEHVVDQSSVANPNLELKLYGTTSKEVQLTGSATDETNPIHLWTGLCETNCAATLRDKNNFVDLSGLGRIKWLSKTSGFQKIHPVIKLADGTLLVADRGEGSNSDWLVNEFAIADLKWVRLDPKAVVTKGTYVKEPDLTKVDEVGFTDLMPGSGHGQGGWSDVAWIEVYGKPVKR